MPKILADGQDHHADDAEGEAAAKHGRGPAPVGMGGHADVGHEGRRESRSDGQADPGIGEPELTADLGQQHDDRPQPR